MVYCLDFISICYIFGLVGCVFGIAVNFAMEQPGLGVSAPLVSVFPPNGWDMRIIASRASAGNAAAASLDREGAPREE